MLTAKMLGSGPHWLPAKEAVGAWLRPIGAQWLFSVCRGSAIALMGPSGCERTDRIAAVTADKELLQAAATRRSGDLRSALFSVCLWGLVDHLTVAIDALSRRLRINAPRGEKQDQFIQPNFSAQN
jgi:hypothetical protein